MPVMYLEQCLSKSLVNIGLDFYYPPHPYCARLRISGRARESKLYPDASVIQFDSGKGVLHSDPTRPQDS